MRVTMKNTKVGDKVISSVNTRNLKKGREYEVIEMINGGFNCGLTVVGDHGKKITPPMSYFLIKHERGDLR